jgi:GNAT superfamily N-acetyltransferase
MKLQTFDFADSTHLAAATAIWNAACGPGLAITERAMRYNTRPVAGGVLAGALAAQDGAAVGFVLASALPSEPNVSPPEVGWVDAIAVHPESQRQGIGTALLAWAEAWLAAQGCQRWRLGGGMRPFAAGLPVELDSAGFFSRCGYAGRAGRDRAWDVAHDLTRYVTPETARKAAGIQARSVASGEEGAVMAFLRREFPGRWRFEFELHLQEGGRLADYVALWSPRGIDGCCVLTFEDSRRPLDRFFPQALPRPWGQLGSIGVSADSRGKGYGAALLDGGLRCLRDAGVAGCVIDWTGIVDFYGRFGFARHREYAMWGKER